MPTIRWPLVLSSVVSPRGSKHAETKQFFARNNSHTDSVCVFACAKQPRTHKAPGRARQTIASDAKKRIK